MGCDTSNDVEVDDSGVRMGDATALPVVDEVFVAQRFARITLDATEANVCARPRSGAVVGRNGLAPSPIADRIVLASVRFVLPSPPPAVRDIVESRVSDPKELTMVRPSDGDGASEPPD